MKFLHGELWTCSSRDAKLLAGADGHCGRQRQQTFGPESVVRTSAIGSTFWRSSRYFDHIQPAQMTEPRDAERRVSPSERVCVPPTVVMSASVT